MDIPQELEPKEKQESIQIHVPLPVTNSSNNANSTDAGKEINLIKVEKERLKELQELGVELEGIGVATIAHAHLYSTLGGIAKMQEQLFGLAQRKDLTGAELMRITNAFGYLAGKLSQVVDTSRKVAESNGRPIDPGSPQKQTRKSFQPGAIIHAAPGSHVQVGFAGERKE